MFMMPKNTIAVQPINKAFSNGEVAYQLRYESIVKRSNTQLLKEMGSIRYRIHSRSTISLHAGYDPENILHPNVSL
jgi:hypothetical protein